MWVKQGVGKIQHHYINSCSYKHQLGSGDIPEIDLRVVEEAKHILADDFDEEEFHQCYHQLYINGKSLNDKPGGPVEILILFC